MRSTSPAPHSAPRLHRVLVRRAIGLVVKQPLLRRLALRVALRHPGLLQRFKQQLKDVMLPAEAGMPAVEAPGPSSPATVLGPRFRDLILDELQRPATPAQQGEP
jgi:hypothetical protein